MFKILSRKERPRKYKTLADVLENTITTSNGCMEWQGYKDKLGYGRTWRHGRSGYKVHRLAMELAGYDIDGWVVLHKCDNPPCCNPAHLTLGTIADNIHDAQAKGRFPVASPKPPKRPTNRPALHGTKSRYGSGCRCDACREAGTRYMSEYRRRKASNSFVDRRHFIP